MALGLVLALLPVSGFARQDNPSVGQKTRTPADPATATAKPANAVEDADTSSPDVSTVDARTLYRELNDLRLDSEHTYQIRDIRLHRGPISLTLENGEIAFFSPLHGRITGAVFRGQGHIIGTPRDPAERLSISHYLGLPLVDLPFTHALFRFTDDTAAELMRDIQSEASGSQPETVPDKALSDMWDPVTESFNPWNSRRILFDWLSTNPEPYFFGRFVSDNPGIFDAVVDPRRQEPVFIGQPREENGDQFYDIWASFTPENTHDQPETFLPVDYTLNTTIADDLSLAGDATLHLKSVRAGERIIPLELSRDLVVTSCSDESGRPLEFFQNDDISRRDLARLGNDQLLVVLPAPTRPGQEIDLKFAYHGNVITRAKEGVYFAGERGSWYPHLGGADHFVPFDIYFRWPKSLTLVATGNEIEETDANGQRQGHWRATATTPLARAGFNLGNYERESPNSDQPKINVYADRQLEQAILTQLQSNPDIAPALPFAERPRRNPFGNTNRTVDDNPPIPNPKEALADLGGEVLDSIHFFERVSGQFPFTQIDVSPIPGRFGQGWPGLLYLPSVVFLPQTAQEQVLPSVLAQEEIRDIVVPHEVAHQWWGNLVGVASYRDNWITEAMSNCLALWYAGSKRHSDHLLADWLIRYREQLLTKSLDARGGTLEDAGALTMGYRLDSAKFPGAYNAIVYGKGAWVMHMLHTMMRDPEAKDPDARFDDFLRYLLKQYRFQPLSTVDFQHAVEKFMIPAMDLEGDHKMDWFFDEWVRETGIPHYSVDFTEKPRGEEIVVSGTLKQDNVPDDFTESVPLYATRPGAKPILLGSVVTTGPETSFHFVSHVNPSKILIDPNLTLLCTTE